MTHNPLSREGMSEFILHLLLTSVVSRHKEANALGHEAHYLPSHSLV